MRRVLIPLALLGVVAGTAMWLRSDQREWTCESPEAEAEFEAAVEAYNRLYFREAYDRLEATLAIDPDFALARVMKLRFLDEEEGVAARAEADSIDLDALSERESFIVQYELANFDRRDEDAERILAKFSSAYPADPFCLEKLGERAWRDQEWELAERHYRELIARHPNWVRAQNYLGYIEMARGNFSAAEDHFRTYLFIAPDQANPYDSMGELLIVLGREREAEEMLWQGLAIRPDFCASYARLVDLCVLQGSACELESVVDEAAKHCADWDGLVDLLTCRGETWTLYDEGDLEGAWEKLSGECADVRSSDLEVLKPRVALLVGRTDVADEYEKVLREHVAEKGPAQVNYSDIARAALAHMEGVRRGVEGDWDGAVEGFQKSDAFLRYWAAQEGTGVFKLYNQLNLIRALESAGRNGEAESILAGVAEINPTIATRYGEMNLRFDGPASP